MKNLRNLLFIIPFGFFLLTTVVGCERADAQSTKLDSPNLNSGTYRDPGPDGNPATYDQDTNNLPQSLVRTYDNVDEIEVQSPTKYEAPPPDACAICRDGTYSQSKNRQGTCSHHGGVAKWLKELL